MKKATYIPTYQPTRVGYSPRISPVITLWAGNLHPSPELPETIRIAHPAGAISEGCEVPAHKGIVADHAIMHTAWMSGSKLMILLPGGLTITFNSRMTPRRRTMRLDWELGKRYCYL